MKKARLKPTSSLGLLKVFSDREIGELLVFVYFSRYNSRQKLRQHWQGFEKERVMEKEAKIRVWWPAWLGIKLAAFSLRVICVAKVTLIGREHKPKRGPRLININHYNLLEDGIILHVLGTLTMPYKKELGQIRGNPYPIFGLVTRFFFRGSGYFPTARGPEGSDQLAIARTRYALRHGWLLLNMPERTHKREKLELLEGKTRGMAKIAIEEDCEIQSVGIINAHGAISDGLRHWMFWKSKRPARHNITVVWGEPFRPSSRGFSKVNDPDGARLLKTIMIRLALLILPNERGVYAKDANEFLSNSTDPDADYYRRIQASLK